MRALMGLIKDRHGTYYAQQRVPERLQEAVARVLKLDKPRLVFLKRSLGTKATKEANTRAKPVQMEFDRTLERAEALLAAKPVRKSLRAIEIRRMTEFYYASILQSDDLDRQRGLVPLSAEDRASLNRFEIDAHSSDEFDAGEILDLAQEALARDRWSSIKLLITSRLVRPMAADLPPGARFLNKPYVLRQLDAELTALAAA